MPRNSLNRNIGANAPKLLTFGRKNKRIYFVLLSLNRNFAVEIRNTPNL